MLTRHAIGATVCAMTHADAEQRFLSLVEEAGLPTPDEIEHWTGEIGFFWHEQKVLVIVELHDEPLTRDELMSIVPAGMAS